MGPPLSTNRLAFTSKPPAGAWALGSMSRPVAEETRAPSWGRSSTRQSAYTPTRFVSRAFARNVRSTEFFPPDGQPIWQAPQPVQPGAPRSNQPPLSPKASAPCLKIVLLRP
jgi:hypothetical protein